MRPLPSLTAAGLFLAALVAALGGAGWTGATSLRTDLGPSAPGPYTHPRFVKPVHGFLPYNHDDPRPAFEVTHSQDLEQVYDLYPAKDAVRPLYEAPLVPAAQADWLTPQSPVLGLKVGPVSHCYPLAVLNWHSLVHDTINGQGVWVFFDPPSGLALARRTWAESRPLGLSGYGYRGVGLAYEKSGWLYDLFWDRHLSFPAASRPEEPRTNTDWLPLERMTWRRWQALHANTLVLSRDTGSGYDYALDPYAAAALGSGGAAEDYWSSDTILAPEALRDASETLRDKEWVLAFLVGQEPWAAPLTALQGDDEIELETAAGPVTIHSDPGADRYHVTDASGRWLPQVRLFWYAWKARYPGTQVLAPPESTE